jgi:hypothetical protein
LGKAQEALLRRVVNKTERLYTEQGLDYSKAFLSALCTLPAESFDRLWAGVLNTSTPFNPNTPRIVDAISAPTDVSNRGTIGTTGHKTQIWKAKLERFIANAVGALIQLVDRHWELLTAGLHMREFRGDPSCGDKYPRRLYYHLELQKLRSDTALYWLRRGLALIRNLRDFEEYLEENNHPRSEGLNQRLRQAYLIYIYAAGFGTLSDLDMAGMKKAFKEDIRYASCRMIFPEPLGLGALLVCGEAVSRLV